MAPTQQQIYARRRAGLGIILVILVILVWSVSNLFATPDSNQLASPTASPEASTPASSQLEDCAPGVVVLRARVEDSKGETNSIAEGETPLLAYEILNTGAVDCNFNVGSRVTFYTITSGDETIWSSRDCDRSQDTDLPVTLPANQSLMSKATLPWERVRSSGDGCGADQPSVTAGGATYKLMIEVNGVFAEEAKAFLLY